MPYRIRKRESVTSAVRRIVREETDKAVGDLLSVPGGRIKGIHEARKCIKKVRATLRLAQPKLGEHFAPANQAYRDISRQLSGPRDAEAIIESLDKLVTSVSDAQHQEVFARIREALVARRDAVVAQSADLNDKVAGLAQLLTEVRTASEHWVIRPDSFASLAAGLERAYRRGRKAMKEAFRAPTDMHFHEWRKEVKAHWYHVRLLRGIWPKVMVALEGELGLLADLLGDDHDLAVLRDVLAGEAWEDGDKGEMKPILALIRKRRQQIRKAGHSLAQHLYVEKASALRKRFGRYWDIWHREARGTEEFQVSGPGDQAEPPPEIVVEAGSPAPEPVDEAADSGADAGPNAQSADASDGDKGEADGAERSMEESPVVGSIHIVTDSLPRGSGRVV
ncbi:MAG: CHAD domain-containing protein [Phycisphaeraceae bacterium]